MSSPSVRSAGRKARKAGYIVFDAETNGLPKTYDAPVEYLANWPRVVQLAWAEYDGRGKHQSAASHIIRPDGFNIPKEAERIHGISTAMAKRKGRTIRYVLGQFAAAVERRSMLVAHNLSFDIPIVGAEFLRAEQTNVLAGRQGFCTMKIGTDVCRIPGRYGYKWPTLTELYWHLFGTSPGATHRADSDVDICAKCFLELKRLGRLP